MRRRVAQTSQARADLVEIATYISRDSPAAARRLVTRLEKRGRLLADFPGIGSPHPFVDRPGFLHISIGEYLLFYRETDEGIEVLRYIHGRRNLAALF